jgi:anti-sigma factor RsiW
VKDIDCRQFVELVTAFLDGGLDAEAQRSVLAHLSDCQGCDRYLDQMRRTTRALGELPADKIPDTALAALLAGFRARRDAGL